MTKSHNIDNSLLPYDIVLVNFIDKLIPHNKIQYDFLWAKHLINIFSCPLIRFC